MEGYNRFVVQVEVFNGIDCSGTRTFVASCDGSYYDGPDYAAALQEYNRLRDSSDGIHNAVIMCAAVIPDGFNPDEDIYYGDWDIIMDNEINEV